MTCPVLIGPDPCGRRALARGLCKTHYERQRAGDDRVEIQPKRPDGAVVARDGDGRKECVRCRAWKPEAAFPSNASSPDGLGFYCRPCYVDHSRRVKLRNPERSRASARRAKLKGFYRLTEDDYESMLRTQGGVCATCLEPPGPKLLVVDHDHSCCPGKRTCGRCVRGLVCDPCNLMLGRVHDDVLTLQRMIEYLGRYKSGDPE